MFSRTAIVILSVLAFLISSNTTVLAHPISANDEEGYILISFIFDPKTETLSTSMSLKPWAGPFEPSLDDVLNQRNGIITDVYMAQSGEWCLPVIGFANYAPELTPEELIYKPYKGNCGEPPQVVAPVPPSNEAPFDHISQVPDSVLNAEIGDPNGMWVEQWQDGPQVLVQVQLGGDWWYFPVDEYGNVHKHFAYLSNGVFHSN